jgi:hypothetical protein
MDYVNFFVGVAVRKLVALVYFFAISPPTLNTSAPRNETAQQRAVFFLMLATNPILFVW